MQIVQNEFQQKFITNENSEDKYCEMLYENYLSDSVENKEKISFEEATKILKIETTADM